MSLLYIWACRGLNRKKSPVAHLGRRRVADLELHHQLADDIFSGVKHAADLDAGVGVILHRHFMSALGILHKNGDGA